MKITVEHVDLVRLLKEYVNHLGISLDDKNVNMRFVGGRKNGTSVEIDVLEAEDTFISSTDNQTTQMAVPTGSSVEEPAVITQAAGISNTPSKPKSTPKESTEKSENLFAPAATPPEQIEDPQPKSEKSAAKTKAKTELKTSEKAASEVSQAAEESTEMLFQSSMPNSTDTESLKQENKVQPADTENLFAPPKTDTEEVFTKDDLPDLIEEGEDEVPEGEAPFAGFGMTESNETVTESLFQ